MEGLVSQGGPEPRIWIRSEQLAPYPTAHLRDCAPPIVKVCVDQPLLWDVPCSALAGYSRGGFNAYLRNKKLPASCRISRKVTGVSRPSIKADEKVLSTSASLRNKSALIHNDLTPIKYSALTRKQMTLSLQIGVFTAVLNICEVPVHSFPKHI